MTPQTTEPTERPEGFPVTVEREIGYINIDNRGKRSATAAAFEMIGQHLDDAPHLIRQSDNPGAVYRFPSVGNPGEYYCVHVTIDDTLGSE